MCESVVSMPQGSLHAATTLTSVRVPDGPQHQLFISAPHIPFTGKCERIRHNYHITEGETPNPTLPPGSLCRLRDIQCPGRLIPAHGGYCNILDHNIRGCYGLGNSHQHLPYSQQDTHQYQRERPEMSCSDSDDDEELLFGPVCTTLGGSSNDALNAPECPELAENAHKASIGGVCMARLLYCGRLWG